MNTNLTIDDVRLRLKTDDVGKWDAVIDPAALTFEDGLLALPEKAFEDMPNCLRPTPWALTQMCQQLGIPTSYFRRCPAHLQDAQFNYWIERIDEIEASKPSRNGAGQSKLWFLRAKKDVLRGVLSERYSVMDHSNLLKHLEPFLDGRFEVSWLELADDSLHLRLIDPKLSRDVLPDDRLYVGIHISNSEVGRRAVTVDALVFRLVCTNGLVRLVKGRSLMHQRHIYLSQTRFEAALRESVGAALTVAAGFLERLSTATDEHLPDVEAVLERLAKEWNLSKKFLETVRLTLSGETSGQQETLYGLANAISGAAQNLPPDDRYEIEVLAGRIIERGVASSALTNGAARA